MQRDMDTPVDVSIHGMAYLGSFVYFVPFLDTSFF
jgi:hypothetical protein